MEDEFREWERADREASKGMVNIPFDQFLAQLMPKKSEADRYDLYQLYLAARGPHGPKPELIMASEKKHGVYPTGLNVVSERFRLWLSAKTSAERQEAGRIGGQTTAKRAAERASAAKRAATRAGPAEPASPPQKRR